MNRAPLLSAFGRDLKYAARVLGRSPAFTATAILTLALAIGANTAVFSLVDAILVKPLPYPEPDRLGYVIAPIRTTEGEYVVDSHNGTTWERLRDNVPAIDAAVTRARSGGQQVNLVVGDSAASVRHARVGSGYFRVLGVAPLAGREFTQEEDRPGGPAVTVLSYGLWQRLFNGDPNAVGKTLLLRGEPHEVVGVMPRELRGEGGDFDVYTPVRPSPTGEGAGLNYGVIARVKPGYTWAEALAAMPALDEEYFSRLMGRNWADAQPSGRFSLVPMQQALTADAAEPLMTLFGAVCAVLLVACVNLAALLFARATGRAKEIATRLALGSGRGAVVRQLFAESLVLGALGGACGLLLSFACLEALKLFGATTYTEWAGVTLDLRALAVTVAVALGASVLFGLFPAFAATAVDVNESLKEGGERGNVRGSRHWTRRSLVAAEMALGAVLLIATGLLVRTFVNVSGLEPGFDAAGVTTASVSLQDARYDTAAKMNRLFDESLRRIESSPGVESAAVSLELPFRRLLNAAFSFVDETDPARRAANVTYATPAYFETLRIPLLAGRTIAETDTASSPAVVTVSQDFVDFLTNGQSPVGRRIRVAGAEREIVGVTGNVKITDTGGIYVPGMIEGPIKSAPLIYLPAAQTPDGLLAVHNTFSPMWSVRAASGAAAETALRSAIASVDPLLPVGAVRPLAELRTAATAKQQLMMVLVGVIGAAALLLSAVGVYGLIAHSVAERRRELGVRLALGATTGRAIRNVAWSGIGLAALGAAAGVVMAWPVAQALDGRGLLWGVDSHDPATFVAGVAFLLVVAAIASIVPALKILRLDPAQALRE
ncbi:MAG TPA: ABC transporter permease [Gammaproteobacteria bacterium]|nr:ABC transporter permease [Gammaproteobacteria bacterium]